MNAMLTEYSVDTQVPIYEYSIEKIWKVCTQPPHFATSRTLFSNTTLQDWYWTEKYPDYQQLRDYFSHVEKVLGVKKDCAFNSRVVGAQFNKDTKRWDISTEDGRTAHAKILINAIGFAAKRHFPDWKGLDSFKGEMHHSSFWPEGGVDYKGKRVAVIGTGSTGIQLAQETAKEAASVTVFQRTPNLCLPMRQRKLSREEQDEAKKEYAQIYRDRMTTFAGFSYDFVEKNTFDDSEEERQKFYEELWDEGGFKFWLGTYKDMLFDKKANDQAYNFWVKKTRERIKDPRKRDILAPTKAPHAWGTKRPSLEQNYYEMMDKPENDVVDVKETPITEFTETGIVTSDGKLREFDIIALATGFDSVTGGMKNMGLKDVEGVELGERWKMGTWSYLGMTCNGFPVRHSLLPITSLISTFSHLTNTDHSRSHRTCSSSTAPKAPQPSATAPRALNAKATGSSTPSPRCEARRSSPWKPPTRRRKSGAARSQSSPTRRSSRARARGTWAPMCLVSRVNS